MLALVDLRPHGRTGLVETAARPDRFPRGTAGPPLRLRTVERNQGTGRGGADRARLRRGRGNDRPLAESSGDGPGRTGDRRATGRPQPGGRHLARCARGRAFSSCSCAGEFARQSVCVTAVVALIARPLDSVDLDRALVHRRRKRRRDHDRATRWRTSVTRSTACRPSGSGRRRTSAAGRTTRS